MAAREKLGWPEPDEIFVPKGVASRLTAELADQKIGRALRALSGDSSIRLGVLSSNPDSTEAPLAIICQFSRPASAQVLLETQRLCWNFSRSLLLLTVEPTLIRKWSCYEKPATFEDLFPNETHEVDGAALDGKKTAQILPYIAFDTDSATFSNENEAFALSWIDLLCGAFFMRESKRFKVEERADQVLLNNLKFARQRLRFLDLGDEFSHDLLARIIFVQFLFDRKDSQNRAALDPEKLAQLQTEGILEGYYEHLAQLLDSYEDTYALFRWLNERFNGDLFPGKGETPEQREAGWQREQENVGPQHLQLLASFVRGDLEMKKGQFCLWRQYAFDAIPLELISNIYEEFVTDAKSAYYTPGHLVDLMLDRVLPWESEDWNQKILDPSCGSGIFLVKAYQRLIYRWKRAQEAQNGFQSEISVAVLRQLLENNLFGVDEHLNAIRVASFSLYLAMCDEIDPRHYWSDEDRVSFPTLRGRTLLGQDFFDEATPGFRTQEDAGTYHLVIGNPPWGDTSVNEAATAWAAAHNWQVANKDFGVLFVAKGMELTKLGGSVCFVQSAGAVLYNHSGKARALQSRVFNGWKKIKCIVNLAAFRPFKNVKVPTCVLVVAQQEPDGEAFWYECPKPFHSPEDNGRITVDLSEMHPVYPDEVESEPWVWSALMWGSSRDKVFLRKVKSAPSLENFRSTKRVFIREGINRGNREKEQKELQGRLIFNGKDFSDVSILSLGVNQLSVNEDIFIDADASTDLDAFRIPQLLIKKSWLKVKGRFQSRLISSEEGTLCSKSYISVHATETSEQLLGTACLTYNSKWANYFLLLNSGRFAFDRSETDSSDLRSLPLPLLGENDTLTPESAVRFRALLEADRRGEAVSLEVTDEAVFQAFEFQKTERILIEDLVEHTLSGFKERGRSASHRPTLRRSNETNEPDLRRYCETLLETLAQTYGADKPLGVRIWAEQEIDDSMRLPMRYISIIFDAPSQRGLQIQVLENQILRARILQLHRHLQETRQNEGYSSQVRDYASFHENGENGLVLNILKPDWLRYWMRSVALHDADEIARDFWVWQNGSEAPKVEEATSC